MLLTVTQVREEPYKGPVMSKRDAILSIFKIDLKGNPSFVWVLISRFLINLGFYIALLYLRSYLIFALKIGSVRNADIFTLVLALVVTFTGLAGTFPAGYLADRMSKKRVIYGTCMLCTLSAIVFWAATDTTWAIVAAAVFGLGFGAFAAVDWALACNVLPEGDAAKFLGIWTFSFVFPQIAAALVAFLVISALKSQGLAFAYRAVFASIIPFMILGTFSVSRVREREVNTGINQE
jgi:MFS family permease